MKGDAIISCGHILYIIFMSVDVSSHHGGADSIPPLHIPSPPAFRNVYFHTCYLHKTRLQSTFAPEKLKWRHEAVQFFFKLFFSWLFFFSFAQVAKVKCKRELVKE